MKVEQDTPADMRDNPGRKPRLTVISGGKQDEPGDAG